MTVGGEITQALRALREGDHDALENVVPLLYSELRRLASQRMRGERAGHTLGTTALVHEAYMRLVDQRKLDPDDREEFLAIASNTMRRVLVDYARSRRRQKRGSGVPPIPLDDVEPFLSERAAVEMIELDDALERLKQAQPRAAKVFELRAFGGLLLEEIAPVLKISAKTAQRDWAAAQAWLRKEVRGALPD